MPTGYTAGILDGKINTFSEFAKTCMRAFGATIHMRDDNSDAEYTPRTPSDYHTKELSKAKQALKELEKMTDDEVVISRKKELEESKKYNLERIEKVKSDKLKLETILSDVSKWTPPTKEHQGIKDFMIEQIEKTIDFDCNTKYHKEELARTEQELKCLNSDIIRADKMEGYNDSIDYNLKQHKEDLKRCSDSNKWVEEFIKSLNG